MSRACRGNRQSTGRSKSLPAGTAHDAANRHPARRTSGRAGRESPMPCRSQCWVGPHHSAVITGIARAGIDALIDLAGGRYRAAAPGAPALRQPPGSDARPAGPMRSSTRARLPPANDRRAVDTIASGKETTLEQRAALPVGAPPTPPTAPREAMDLGVPARRQHIVQARKPPGRNAGATCTSSARRSHSRPNGTAIGRPGVSGDRPRPASALATRRRAGGPR